MIVQVFGRKHLCQETTVSAFFTTINFQITQMPASEHFNTAQNHITCHFDRVEKLVVGVDLGFGVFGSQNIQTGFMAHLSQCVFSEKVQVNRGAEDFAFSGQ